MESPCNRCLVPFVRDSLSGPVDILIDRTKGELLRLDNKQQHRRWYSNFSNTTRGAAFQELQYVNHSVKTVGLGPAQKHKVCYTILFLSMDRRIDQTQQRWCATSKKKTKNTSYCKFTSLGVLETSWIFEKHPGQDPSNPN